MKENPITIRVGQGLENSALAKGQTFIEWFQDSLDLAAGVDEGNIYQKIGGEYQKLRITDVNPFMEESILKPSHLFIVMPETYDQFVNKTASFKDWALRVISLGLLAKNLDLYFYDGEDYEKIVFISNSDRDLDIRLKNGLKK